jgi:hypothetical protein
MEQKHLADLSIKALLLKYDDVTRKIYCKSDYQTELDFLVRSEARNKFIKNLALSLNATVDIEFFGKVLKVSIDEIIPLSDGSSKLARNITVDDDINDAWIEEKLNKLDKRP